MTPARQPFPWQAAMAAGLGTLRITPQAFWAMTPRELAAALQPHFATPAAPPADTLADLMRRYPDTRS